MVAFFWGAPKFDNEFVAEVQWRDTTILNAGLNGKSQQAQILLKPDSVLMVF